MKLSLEQAKRISEYNSFITKHCYSCRDHLKVNLEKETEANMGRWLLEKGYFSAPASTKYHGAYKGGLFDHSLRVAERLIWLTESLHLSWEYPDSPAIVGLFHDICKVDRYEKLPDGHAGDTAVSYGYRSKLIYEGHGYRSLCLLQGHLVLSEEEAACIVYHMGAYEKDMWDGYDEAIRRFPNVLYTHTADMLASKVDGV